MEPFIPHGSSIMVQFMFWFGTSLLIGTVSIIVYLWKENGRIKKERQDEVFAAIKQSIDNLSNTITDATHEFKDSMRHMWEHIDELHDVSSWLIGQHEANHKIKYEPRKRAKSHNKEE